MSPGALCPSDRVSNGGMVSVWALRAHAQLVGCGMRPLQAHCHRGLGTPYATTGQREQARIKLSTAIAMYQTMEMTFWLPETEAVLVQVER